MYESPPSYKNKDTWKAYWDKEKAKDAVRTVERIKDHNKKRQTRRRRENIQPAINASLAGGLGYYLARKKSPLLRGLATAAGALSLGGVSAAALKQKRKGKEPLYEQKRDPVESVQNSLKWSKQWRDNEKREQMKNERHMKKIGFDKLYVKKKKCMKKKASAFGLDKIAASDSTGVSQLKQRRTITRKNYTAEGTGLGAGGGGLAAYKTTKALGPKWNIPATLAGMVAGGIVGKYVGDKGSKTKTKSIEGVIKKQEKRKDSPVKLPLVKRDSVRGLLSYNK